MRGRAYRRFQEQRHKKKAERKLQRWNVPVTSRQIGIWATTKKTCSCVMCGNPRKWFGEKTLKELLLTVEEEDEL